MENKQNDEKQFREWLNDRSDRLFTLKDGRERAFIQKAEKNQDFTYLYSIRSYDDKGLQRYAYLEYAGIYHEPSGFIYDASKKFTKFFPGIEYSRGTQGMCGIITSEVCSIIEGKISENLACLGITDLSEEYKKKLQDFEEYSLAHRAKTFFLAEKESDKCFKCKYTHSEWEDDDALMRYISDPDAYIKNEADSYMSEHAEDILLDIKENERTEVECRKMEEQEDSPLHRLRNIQNALKGIAAKTLKVTINKDGKEFSFKTESWDLKRDFSDGCTSWLMPATDRRKYRELFGNTHYYPDEITKISYFGKPIYSAELIEAVESETEGIAPQM